MAGRRTIRFTRRVNDTRGDFAGVVMVSTEPSYLASLSNEDEFNPGDFVSVSLMSGPMLVLRTEANRERLDPFFTAAPHFDRPQGVRKEPASQFTDRQPRYVAWKKIDDYPLIAVAAITERSAEESYAPTRLAWLLFASVTSLLVIAVAVAGGVTAVRNAERRRKAERVRATFRLAVDGAREAFLMVEPVRTADGTIVDYRVEDCNERAAALYRMPREKLIGRCVSQTYQGEQRLQMMDFFNEAFKERFLETEFLIGGNEVHLPGWFHRRAVRSGDGIAVTIRDITDAKLHEQALASLAVTDTLTGLPNRRWLNDYMPGALQRARAARKRVALLFIDLDNFKTINDTLGHATGDELLRAAALCLKCAVRSSDHVVRLGGDEFTVLIENLERDTDAELVAAQVVKAFASSDTFTHWATLNVSCSVGVALYPTHAQDADSLLKAADRAMYEAKTSGKGRYCVYPPAKAADQPVVAA
jgi:diguanylate cyclase (GGDEF)-like protein